MGVTSFSQYACTVAPARMFKALMLDNNFMPKLMPHGVKRIDTIEGDGESAGSIKQITFVESSDLNYVKNRIEVLDKENFVCKYTLIEGDALGDKLDSIFYEIEFEASGDGGCICKTSSDYHTKGDVEIKDEEIKAAKDLATELYKVVEAYLIRNPDAYT